MIITIISKLHDDAQAWTLDIKADDLEALARKYDGRGESVTLSADDLPDDIQHYYK